MITSSDCLSTSLVLDWYCCKCFKLHFAVTMTPTSHQPFATQKLEVHRNHPHHPESQVNLYGGGNVGQVGITDVYVCNLQANTLYRLGSARHYVGSNKPLHCYCFGTINTLQCLPFILQPLLMSIYLTSLILV